MPVKVMPVMGEAIPAIAIAAAVMENRARAHAAGMKDRADAAVKHSSGAAMKHRAAASMKHWSTTTAVEHCGATTVKDCGATAVKYRAATAAAVKDCAAATTVERCAASTATAEMSPSTSAATEMRPSTSATAAATMAATVANFDHQPAAGGFRRRRRAGIDQRQRLCALHGNGRKHDYRRSRQAQAAPCAARGIWNLDHA
jgi:hypothetical protein